jgi:hypothetical protein
MQEWCTCNASFKTRSYRRLKQWRDNHRHEIAEQPDPEPQGSQSLVERSYQDDDMSVRVGFQVNEQRAGKR